MKPKRVLTLRSEALGELTTEELTGVAGAAIPTSPLVYCLSQELNCAINDPYSLVCWIISDYVC